MPLISIFETSFKYTFDTTSHNLLSSMFPVSIITPPPNQSFNHKTGYFLKSNMH